MLHTMRYRLALDLGTTSLGWAMLRLNQDNHPYAIIKSGVRIFGDGRNPKDGSSLAVTRREARAMRRRRDRLLKRKARMLQALIDLGFFPKAQEDRKKLESLNPYELRAKGLDQALKPAEFARALFHINQRRGFKSNRKTDKKDNDSGALKTAINKLYTTLSTNKVRTVGEWLYQRQQVGETVRARFRQSKTVNEEGKSKIEKSYDLYIDRAMVEREFDLLWAKQSELNAALFNPEARDTLKDILLFQRPLKPVIPGRCTLMPDEERAPLALPSQQRFRIYQEVNNLRILQAGLKDVPLTKVQRNLVVDALETSNKKTFTQLKKLLGLDGTTQFNLEDEKRTELKGNYTNAIMAKPAHFDAAWYSFTPVQQDVIVMQLLKEENESTLIAWLKDQTGVDEARAEAIANVSLVEGYGSLSAKALAKILPALQADIVTYDKAVIAAGFNHHSNINHAATGEILEELPYYGEYLQRHVGFGTGVIEDSIEKRYGKIANPTVHIGLNQIRTVVNALIKRYGHPSEVIVEVARDLKQSQEQRREQLSQQAKNQVRNARLRTQIAEILQIHAENVKVADIQKMILWEELSFDIADRKCPYSGQQISTEMLLSDAVEIEHILPFSQTLDDSLNNKTVSLRHANRIKGNRTPWEARDGFATQGWDVEAMLARASQMPKGKRYRFGEEGYQKWLREDKGFLARALNDTRHLSRVAKEYLSLICPANTRVIPGQMTALLRAKFGLNDLLGLKGIKNRNDHRHHAIDACVIGITDQAMLQRFAQASASAREQQLNKLVDTMPLPWETYRSHVARAINAILISHKPDHSHEGQMHNDTAYALLDEGMVSMHKWNEGVKERVESKLSVIQFTNPNPRHGILENGEPKPYKGYKGDSNYCIEIIKDEKGNWQGEVISTYTAYQIVRQFGLQKLRHPTMSISNQPLVMRLMKNDTLKLEIDGAMKAMMITKVSGNGQIFMAELHEANVDARNRDKADDFTYTSKTAGSLQKAKGRKVTISPIGELSQKPQRR